jgi:hypothetical protein
MATKINSLDFCATISFGFQFRGQKRSQAEKQKLEYIFILPTRKYRDGMSQGTSTTKMNQLTFPAVWPTSILIMTK